MKRTTLIMAALAALTMLPIASVSAMPVATGIGVDHHEVQNVRWYGRWHRHWRHHWFRRHW